MGELVFPGIVMGLGATVLMDLWAILLNRAAGQDLPNWALVGRWVRHLGKGRVFHDDIAAAEPYGQDLPLGWTFHYAVGVVYGVVFLWIVGADWLAAPSFWPAWVFGIVTVAAGWFLLQPGLGLGWAASRTEAPWAVRFWNLAAHTVFAVGLYWMALVVG